jgi:RNA polymerase sigma-70 factor (ECF subfamily)
VTTLTHLENEASLLDEARGGSAEAFVTLLRQYERHVYRLALRILGNSADAEDVLQETSLKAFVHIKDFRGDSRFYSWIVRIATNECLMKLRRGRGIQQLSLDEPEEGDDGSPLPREIEDWRGTPEQRYLKSELETIVAEGIDKLDRVSRLVFTLRDVEGFSTDETSTMTGLSVPAVKTRLFRARLRMREHMNSYFAKG